ncbi:MAG: hypothetical protein IPN11_10925 [Opitutaceae bacterium]|nr:hypothetical protein [Opitutaceae bacterium]
MNKKKSARKSARKSAKAASRRPASPPPPAKYERDINLAELVIFATTSKEMSAALLDCRIDLDRTGDLGINPLDPVDDGFAQFETNNARAAREFGFRKRTKKELAELAYVPTPAELAEGRREFERMDAKLHALCPAS